MQFSKSKRGEVLSKRGEVLSKRGSCFIILVQALKHNTAQTDFSWLCCYLLFFLQMSDYNINDLDLSYLRIYIHFTVVVCPNADKEKFTLRGAPDNMLGDHRREIGYMTSHSLCWNLCQQEYQ